jgi:OOP family OmpA-OmpF porin
LVKNGISERRLSVNGYGKTKHIAPNDSEEGRSLNRRIEVIITKK